ncbi:MAG: cyclohexa-1,5-dienecarbonyl-CoA hydratase [Gammaproteobacteria bacterium]|nr:cyclohexa-1,5-dienecarbonyl-CoA hydratase [Gammaproteobacteria bacterium]MDH3429476.1 cyclohexa-1,5-dienecarbonyl-CoA hydratase [Gammaproteobacteria bacterium]MDH3434566.1 cyclohexa-1,5-dienecarbonyl-CoA hydratase [Gammaproteobacteria bacterium]
MTDGPIKTWLERDEQVLRLQLARPKANIIDARMIDALSAALDTHVNDQRLLAVVLDAEGPHFSFGASVEEHLPDQCAAMLGKINSLVMQMLEYPVPIVAAVQGQCLGGGLEVACAASLIITAPDSQLGQPEISLAVFAPAASCLLPERLGQARAEMLLLSGKSVDAQRAKRIGLVDEVSESPADAALTWIDENIVGKSASSLRIAVTAARQDYIERIRTRLATVETLYIEKLMRTKDPVEGLNAFLEKRKPIWENDREGANQ